jgi:hypothetical protein
MLPGVASLTRYLTLHRVCGFVVEHRQVTHRCIHVLENPYYPGMVVYTYNPSTGEA